MNRLYLDVEEFTDPDHWRWVLSDTAGAVKQIHSVSLNRSDAEYQAFVDPYRTLRYSSVPDRQIATGMRLVENLGRWMGTHVLGAVGRGIVDCAPVVVLVRLPRRAEVLLYRPFELSHVNGRPIALQGASLIYQIGRNRPVESKRAIGPKLRMLAIFSLPTEASALNLRRERFALEKLIARLTLPGQLGVELQVVQYGVSRVRLQQLLAEREGWDLIHFSGHGLPGAIVLEKPDGRGDEVSAEEFLDLMEPAREGLKLVTVSACESAAPVLREAAGWLGLDVASVDMQGLETPSPDPERAYGLGWAMADRLNCAVLAMRFPIGDEFAIRLATHFYESLLHAPCSVAIALQTALPLALPSLPIPGAGPLSVGTPALFGECGASLTLAAPQLETVSPQTPRFVHFPPENEHFVGRVTQMARASEALAPHSGLTAILLHGMPGSGKTACALELARRYDDNRFDSFVWYKAPDEGTSAARALLSFALAMEKQLPGFKMAHIAGHREELYAWLPVLQQLLERRRVLLVLDNLESLLTKEGNWHDPNWGAVMRALVAHSGSSRIVITSRRKPLDMQSERRVLAVPIHSLSLNESILLAAELPNLGQLLRGEMDFSAERARRLVLGMLAAAQGHPKLIHLADKQASHAESLQALLQFTGGSADLPELRVQAFFRQGYSSLEPEDFVAAFEKWTSGIALSLTAAARTVFYLICALEEEDRDQGVLSSIWPSVLEKLKQPVPLPNVGDVLSEVAASGLVESEGEDPSYRVHPIVAEFGRGLAGPDFLDTVCALLSEFWTIQYGWQVVHEFQQLASQEGVLLASLRAAPYYFRRRDWEHAAILLEGVVDRARSPEVLDRALPWLRRIYADTAGTRQGRENAGVLAKALYAARRLEEAEEILRTLKSAAEREGETSIARVAAIDLIDLLTETGRIDEALRLADERLFESHARHASRIEILGDEAQRLRVLGEVGQQQEVLAEAERLRAEMRDIPEQIGNQGQSSSWNTRELILSVGQNAALRLGKTEQTISFNDDLRKSEVGRGAPALVQALTAYHSYIPLMALGRYPEAIAVLQNCRKVFEAEEDLLGLSCVFNGLALLEAKLDNHAQALVFAEAGLRYVYLNARVGDCAGAHLLFGSELFQVACRRDSDFEMAQLIKEVGVCVAHTIAASIVFLEISLGKATEDISGWPPDLSRAIVELACYFSHPGIPPSLPATFDEVCQIVERTEGVAFGELYGRLSHGYGGGDGALAKVIELARHLVDMSRQR